MTTLHDCALGGVTLSSLDESICVTDVIEEAPVYRAAFASAWGEGQQLLSRRRESLSVTVRFAVHETDPVRRKQVLGSIRAWAEKAGMLTLPDRPGQQLAVFCAALPELSAQDMPATLTLRFTSLHCPWWVSAAAVTFTDTKVMALEVPGNAPVDAPVEAVVFNKGIDTIDRLTLMCGMTEIVFEGITFPAGSCFSLMYHEGTLLAWIDGESVLHCRTANSSDDLLAPCGKITTAYVTGDELLQTTFAVRGRFL